MSSGPFVGTDTSGRRPRRRAVAALGLVLVLATTNLYAAPVGAEGGVVSPRAGGAGEPPHASTADGSVFVTNASLSGVESLVRFDSAAAPESLGPTAIEVAMSNSGEVVATLDAARTLRVLDAGGSTTVSVPVGQPISNLAISGNGRFLAFAAPPAQGGGLSVHRYDRTTRQLIVLPADPGVVNRPIEMSDDGARVLVWRGDDPDVGQLGVFDVEALTLTKVTVAPVAIVDAALSPDGSSVFFASSAALVGGVASGVHLYQTTIADRLIQLVPVTAELDDTLEISAGGHVLAQRSRTNTRLIHVIDRRTDEQWLRAVPGAVGDDRVTPIGISDDTTTMLVAIESCAGGSCTVAVPAMAIPTGANDPLALRWVESDRPLQDGLDRLYLAATGRPADASGRAFWLGRLVAGDSLRSVALALLQSPEGVARFGGAPTPEAVVERALSGVLGRPVTPDDIIGLLGGVDRNDTAALVVAASSSIDAVTATDTAPPQSASAGQLIRLYRAVFGRFPDAAGYRYWAEQQANGLSLDAMIDAFAVSREYERRYGTNPSDAVAVAQLYRNVLGREPDAAGSAYWLEQLARGASRNVMLHAFVDSAENVIRTGTQP